MNNFIKRGFSFAIRLNIRRFSKYDLLIGSHAVQNKAAHGLLKSFPVPLNSFPAWP